MSGKKPQKPTIIVAGTVGTTHEFVSGGEETWPIYMEHLNIYFKANGIQDAQRRKNILLTAMGTSTYIQLRKLSAPKKPEDLSFNEIDKTLSNFYNPTSTASKYVKRDEFNKRKQKPGETFAEFFADLNGLSEQCGFDNVEDAILGQILSGMRDLGLKKHLLQQQKLTLNEAKRKGLASDTGYTGVRTMSGQSEHKPAKQPSSAPPKHHHESQGSHGPKMGQHRAGPKGPKAGPGVTVHTEIRVGVTSAGPAGASKTTCHRCGGPHPADKCFQKDKTCNYCKKTGHIVSMCRVLKAKEKK